jgi:hypothetical protein
MMDIQNQRFTCQRCGEVFDAETLMAAPIAVTLASLQAVTCPKCHAGYKEVGLGGEKPGVPGLEVPIAERASWWWDHGERGTSSETIFCACAGRGLHRADYPYDPDDYRRCHRLLGIVPEWRGELARVTDRWPWFAPFERRWPEFEKLWEEESKNPGGMAPKLYEALQEARLYANRIRNQEPPT